MERTLAQARAVYESFFARCPNLPEATRAKGRDLLDDAEMHPEPTLRLQAFTELNDLCVPAFQPLAQGGYSCYDYGEHMHDFPGSLGHRMRLVVAALRESRQIYLGWGGYVLAVYPDYAVVCKYSEEYDSEGMYYRVAFSMGEDEMNVTLGEMSPCDVVTIDVDKGVVSSEVDDDEMTTEQDSETVNQAEKTKTDGGQQFTVSAYLIVPDADKTSTWKVRVEESPGKVTVAQLGRAYAALTKGFRGNTVEASETEISAAKKKLRGLYKKYGATWPGDKKQATVSNISTLVSPDKVAERDGAVAQAVLDPPYPVWLLQGEDPPGGEEELAHTFTATLRQESKRKKTGRMKVSGVATVGNVVNRNGMVYPTEVWQDNIPRLQELIEQSALTGESDHPQNDRRCLDRIALKYTSVWMDGDEMKFEAEVIPTVPAGQNLEVLLDSEVRVDISSYGFGRSVTQKWTDPKSGQVHEKIPVVQRGFRCDALDAVLRGASPGSTISSHTQAARDAAEEELEMSQLTELQQQLAEVAAQVNIITQAMNGSGATPPAVPPAVPPVVTPPATSESIQQGLLGASHLDTLARMEQYAIAQRKRDLLEEARQKWPQMWVNVYRNHLDKVETKTIVELEKKAQEIAEIVQTAADQAPTFPGGGFTVKQDAGNRPGPKTPEEMLDFLVQHLPDGPTLSGQATNPETGRDEIDIPNWLNSPRQQCKKVLRNMANLQEEGFNGASALQTLVLWHQGFRPDVLGENWMKQACADGTTSVAAAGAPASCVFLFPLVTRVWPLLIANEVASIQPMDKPDGKIFFMDFLKIVAGASFTDEGGILVSDRVKATNSSLFSSSYSNKAAECDTSIQLQLRIASKNVSATTKQIHSNWTQEVAQDLRAYHNLDAATLLLEGQARQVALEWNLTVLNGMLVAAGAGNRNYGTLPPAGFTVEEWERYITRYVDYSSVDIMAKRHLGGMTHIVAGTTAGARLSALNRWAVVPVGSPNPEMFPGLVLAPWTGQGTGTQVKAFITSLWTNQNANKILVIRRGPTWSDTPYVWAPYADYVSPVLTTPSNMTHQRGIMSRAAHTSVVPEAMATITVQEGVLGAAL